LQDNRRIWTVKQLLEWSENYFFKKKIPQPRISAEILLSHVLNFSRMQLYINYERVPDSGQLAAFRQYIQKRVEHMPVQYILSQAHFRNITLYVDENVLIPRPETELLVDSVLLTVKDMLAETSRGKNINILEIGTGSGAIAVSLAQELDNYISKNMPENISGQTVNWHIIATEYSNQALNIARKNAEKILDSSKYEKLEFINADIICENDEVFRQKYMNSFNIVVSNPPYISTRGYDSLPEEIRLYEPKDALLAGADGLEVYEKILQKIFPFLDTGFAAILFETDPATAPGLKKLLEKYALKNSAVLQSLETENDYNQRQRILSARLIGKTC
jgi:release factor glutamine methyltransferase